LRPAVGLSRGLQAGMQHGAYGRAAGYNPSMGYAQPQMGRFPQAGWPAPVPYRPGMAYQGATTAMQGQHPSPGVRYPGAPGVQTPRAAAVGRPAKQGPPRREMDSLLEEIKAKQRLQEQKKEILKNAEAQAAAAAEAAAAAGSPEAGLAAGGCNASAVAGGGVVASALAGTSAGGAVLQLPGGVLAGAEAAAQVPPGVAEATKQGTCLFLRELPSATTQDVVSQLFKRYGGVVACDVVRAKDKVERTKCYITMDSRENAQRAKDALQDREVDGVPLSIEWATIPLQVTGSQGDRREDGSKTIVVEPPVYKLKRKLIDRLAKYVAQEGHPFEQIIMERESQEGANGNFGFLFKHDTPDNVYYRWRTFAFAQGDNFKRWHAEPFRITEGGPWWIPPPCEFTDDKKLRSSNFSSGPAVLPAGAAAGATSPAAANSAVRQSKTSQVGVLASWTQEDIEEEKERVRLEEKATLERQRRDRDKKGLTGGKRLSDADWDKFEQLLRGVTGSRSLILEVMAFCLDKSDWAIEITECLTESLTILETDVNLKLARLMVVSDILHNTCSSRPSAWAYRREFERSLPDILEHLHLSLIRQESRLAADRAREQVIRILHIWEDWGLFAPQFVRGLEAALCVGVRRLRSLAAKDDNSREPAWLAPKLLDWRRQHFSQLEKMCRTRGLRSSTSHLEATKDLSLEEVRKEWLIDRLVTYELHAHEKGQARLTAAASSQVRRGSSRVSDDIDGEAISCDMDGFPLEEAELDGKRLELGDLSALLRIVEATRQPPDGNLGGGFRDDVNGSSAGLGSSPLAATGLPQEPDALGAVSHASDEVVGVVLSAETDCPAENTLERPASPPAESATVDTEDMLDIERPEDPSVLEPDAAAGEDAATGSGAEEAAAPKIDHGVLRNIELEVMELRASLETQGLHRDAIDDICDEKRQRLIDEHESNLASPAQRASSPEENGDEQDQLDAARVAAAAAAAAATRTTVQKVATSPAAAGKTRDKEKSREAKETRERETKTRRRSRGKEAAERRSRSREAGEKRRDRTSGKATSRATSARSSSRDRKDRSKRDRGKSRSRSRQPRDRVKKGRR